MKEKNNQNQWNFDIGFQESLKVPIWNIKGFQQRDRQDSQSWNIDIFSRLPVSNGQCVTRTEKNNLIQLLN